MEDPLSSLPGYLLRRASASALAELNQQLAAIEANHTNISLLFLIGANPGITQSDAARLLGIQRANMVGLIARIEARGWIVRERVDGRSQALSLTRVGKSAQKRAWAIVEPFEASLLERVPTELRGHVMPILRHLWRDGPAGADDQ
jgi:DNA-binding MarR family transcriptional regulator